MLLMIIIMIGVHLFMALITDVDNLQGVPPTGGEGEKMKTP